MRIAAAFALLVATASTARADGYSAVATTTAGDCVTVSVDLGTLHVESSLGNFDLDPAKISRIDFLKDKQVFALADGTQVSGKPALSKLSVRSRFLGAFEIQAGTLQRLELKGKDTAAAAEANPPVAPRATFHVETRDGSRFQGKIELDTIEVTASFGKFTLKTAELGRVDSQDGQAVVRWEDNTVIRGKLSPARWPVTAENLGKIEVAVDNIFTLQRQKEAGGTETKPPPGLSVKTLARLPVAMALSSFHVSPDGKTLQALDTADAKLRTLSLETLQWTAELQLPAGTTTIQFDLSGKGAVACASGTVAIVDVGAGKVARTFRVESALLDAVPVTEDLLLGATQEGLVAISSAKQAIVRRFWSMDHPAAFAFHPDGRRIYATEATLHLAEQPTSENLCITPHRTLPALWRCAFSPDGRFLVTHDGAVLMPGKSDLADLAEAGKVEAHLGSVFSGERLFIFTSAGFAKVYDMKTLDLVKSTSLEFQAWFAIADPGGKTLTLYGKAGAANGAYGFSAWDRKFPPGEFVRIDRPE